jgi:hypothetical protein
MKSITTMKHRLLVSAGLVGLLLAGCSSAPEPHNYDLRIELDPSLAGSSIQMDLIGANAVSDLPKWQSYSVTEYWQPGNVMRHDADKAVVQFGQGKPNVQVFASTDPAWNRWLTTGALYLVVLVDLPGISSDREGNADPRRLILPLDRAEWPGGVNTIALKVQESGIRLLTPKRTK